MRNFKIALIFFISFIFVKPSARINTSTSYNYRNIALAYILLNSFGKTHINSPIPMNEISVVRILFLHKNNPYGTKTREQSWIHFLSRPIPPLLPVRLRP